MPPRHKASTSSNPSTIQIPVWLIGILVTILITLLGVIFYAGQTYGETKDLDKRLTRIEDGVDKLWQRQIVGPTE